VELEKTLGVFPCQLLWPWLFVAIAACQASGIAHSNTAFAIAAKQPLLDPLGKPPLLHH